MISRIKIEYDTPNATEISKAIVPDNVEIPKTMKISVRGEGGKLYIEVEMEITSPKDVLTLRNTVDEILSHVGLAEKVIKGVEGEKSD